MLVIYIWTDKLSMGIQGTIKKSDVEKLTQILKSPIMTLMLASDLHISQQIKGKSNEHGLYRQKILELNQV